MAKEFAWSYSALTLFETCPKKFYAERIAKTAKDKGGAKTDYGRDAHLALEHRIKSGKRLPMDFAHLEPIAAKLAALPGEKLVEQKMALDRQFQPTSFFADDVYVRSVADLAIVGETTALLADYKTGKNMSDDFTQLKLTGAMFMVYRPEISRVTCAYLWTQHKTMTRAVLQREEMPELWSGLIARANRIERAIKMEEFPARPNGLCRKYCSVTSCPHHGGGT